MGMFGDDDAFDPPPSVWSGVWNFDHLTWNNVKGMNVVQTAQQEAKKYAGDDLTREAFFGVYNRHTKLEKKAPDGMRPVHSIMKRAEGMPEFDALRRSVRGDSAAAAIATARFMTEIMKNLPAEVKEEMEKNQQAKQRLAALRARMAKRGQNQGDAEGIAMGQGSPDGDEEGEGILGGEEMTDEALAEAIRRAEEDEEETAQKVEEALSHSEAQMQNTMSKGMLKAAERVDNLRDMQQAMSWGSEQGSGGDLMPEVADDLEDLIEYINSNGHLKKIFDMMGWAEQMVEAELKKSVIGKDNLVEYLKGEFDPENIAPEEFVSLASEQNSPGFLDLVARIADDDVLIPHYEGEEKAGKGPVVFVKDTSGSTMGDVFAMLSAIDFVLMQHITGQGRLYACIPFSGQGQFEVFKPGPVPMSNLKRIIAHLKAGYMGGTEPYAPISKAIDLILEDPDFKKGYVLIGTDGAFSAAPPAFLEKLKQVREKPGIEVYAFVIGCTPGAATSFTDKIIRLSQDVNDRDKIAELVAPVL